MSVVNEKRRGLHRAGWDNSEPQVKWLRDSVQVVVVKQEGLVYCCLLSGGTYPLAKFPVSANQISHLP